MVAPKVQEGVRFQGQAPHVERFAGPKTVIDTVAIVGAIHQPMRSFDSETAIVPSPLIV